MKTVGDKSVLLVRNDQFQPQRYIMETLTEDYTKLMVHQLKVLLQFDYDFLGMVLLFYVMHPMIQLLD